MKKAWVLFALFLLSGISAYSQEVKAEKAYTVPAGAYLAFDYAFAQPSRMWGRFRAEGGKGNDIEAFVLDDDSFENWKNGHQVKAYYQSGRVTVATYDVTLPKGNYHFVFSNTFSIVTPKALTVW